VKRTVAVLGFRSSDARWRWGLADSKEVDVVAFDYRPEEVEAVSSRVRQAVTMDVRQTELLEEFSTFLLVGRRVIGSAATSTPRCW